MALSTAISSVQSKGAFIPSSPTPPSPAFLVQNLRGGDGDGDGYGHDGTVTSSANHTSITAVQHGDEDIEEDLELEDVDVDIASFESEVGYDDFTTDIHDDEDEDDNADLDSSGEEVEDKEATTVHVEESNIINDDDMIVRDDAEFIETMDDDTSSHDHHVFNEISLTQEEEDAIQAQEEAFPDVPTASDGEGLYSTMSMVDADVVDDDGEDIDEHNEVDKDVEVDDLSTSADSTLEEVSPTVEREDEEEVEEEMATPTSDDEETTMSMSSSPVVDDMKEDEVDDYDGVNVDDSSNTMESMDMPSMHEADVQVDDFLMETSDGGDFDVDIDVEIDYPSGSDSAAFVDRMDLADAYDTDVDIEIDNDIYDNEANIREDDDEASIEMVDDGNVDEIGTQELSDGEMGQEEISNEEEEQIPEIEVVDESVAEFEPEAEAEEEELDLPPINPSVTSNPVPTKQGPTVQYMITENMRRVLIRKLGYKPWEVANMKPEVATVVVDKMLSRPIKGMPEEFYIDYDAAIMDRGDTKKKLWGLFNKEKLQQVVSPGGILSKDNLKRIATPALASGLTIIVASSALSGSSDGVSTNEEEVVLTQIKNTPSQDQLDDQQETDQPDDQQETVKVQSERSPKKARKSPKKKPPSKSSQPAEETTNSDDLETEELLTKLVEDAGAEDAMGDSNIIDRVITFLLEKIDEIFKRPF